MVREIVAPILRFLGLGQFGLAKMSRTSNSDAPAYFYPSPEHERPETSIASPFLALAGLVDKYPALLGNEAITTLLDGEGNASLWEIIEVGHKEGIIPQPEFDSLRVRREALLSFSEITK